MLIVAHAGREREVMDIFRKWDLDAVVIGRVRDTGRMQVLHNGEQVADIPVSALTDEAPKYERPMRAAESPSSKVQSPKPADQIDHTAALLKLLASGNICSKHWVYRQYDHMVRTNTAILPGADAAVIRIKETRRALAMTLDGNGRYCAANPREGAKLVVAEAARNVVCVGAKPVAITNCLNFASPEKPEVMWSFSEVIDGMAEACRAFGTPVVSGNVSFYNETEGRGILPTPVIGMVGLIEDVRRVVQPGFKKEGDIVVLLGTTEDDLSLSEYASVCSEGNGGVGAVPKLDLDRELSVQRTCLEAAEAGLLQSAHDCADGGLGVALAENCFSTLGRISIGAQIKLASSLPAAVTLFSESPSRIIVSLDSNNLADLERIAVQNSTPFAVIGRVSGTALDISLNGDELIALEVSELETVWRTALSHKLEAEAMAAGN